MTKSILFISKGEKTSSTRYRALQYFPFFIDHGWVPHHVSASGGLLAILLSLKAATKADVVVVLRKTFPRPWLWLLRRAAKKLIFDLDDAIFCNTDGSYSKTRMLRFAAMAKASDCIFAGNVFLAKQAVKFNPSVHVIPTSVDVSRYQISLQPEKSLFIDLVWIGSHSTRKYLLDCLPALNQAAQQIPSLRLKVIADFDLPEAIIPTLAVPWDSATEANELARSHIGLAPMRNDDWSRGKCALKVLQYMAAGLPVISSNAGANAKIVHPGETGLLVSTHDEWSAAIKQLAADENMRLSMGLAGQSLVKGSYDISVVFEKMISVMENTY